MAKKDRPPILHGNTIKIRTECGTLFVTINADKDNKPMEVMARMGKSGGCLASYIEALGRMITLALQYDVPPDEIAKQLRAIRCPSPAEDNGDKILSCADAFSKAIIKFGNMALIDEPHKCPKCKVELTKEKQSLVCKECGFERSD